MTNDFMQRQKDDVIRDISSFGSLFFYILAVLIFLILGNYRAFVELLAGLAIIYIVTAILRTVFFKERPRRYNYNSYIEKLDAASFPSLHASRTAFIGAFFMAYFGNIILAAALVLMTLLIAYSRIYLKRHDFKDVAAGIILGILVYFAVQYLV